MPTSCPVLTHGIGDVLRHPDWDVVMLAGCSIPIHRMVPRFSVLRVFSLGPESLVYRFANQVGGFCRT